MKRTIHLIFVLMTLILIGPKWDHSLRATESIPAQAAGHVEIVVRNSSFRFHGGTLKPLQPTVLLLRNLDDKRHGFVSDMLETLDIEVAGEGMTTFGKGIRGVHVDPGKSIQLHFTPLQEGKFQFNCDIHPNMKGELLVLQIQST